MIIRIRAAAHDEQETGYEDITLLSYINDGLRFVRRTIMDIYPMYLADFEVSGSVEAGEWKLLLPYPISTLIDVRINGKRLKLVNPHSLDTNDKTGVPRFYYMQGCQTVCLVPRPDRDYRYELTAIKDMALLTLDDSSPLTNDMDDFLYEYVLIRASLTNEFDMSQEATIMSSIVNQITSLIRSNCSHGVQVDGYWQPVATRSDY
jgi:hypothetical protein